MGNEVFVSYSQPDRDCALELVGQLEAGGVGCWIAPRDIAPAADWAAAIIEAINNARIMVLVFSASSNASPQVRREVERAVHKQLRILPFRIENVLPSQSLEYFLSAAHWLDAFPPPRAPHYARLCEYLRAGPNTGATARLLALDTPAGPAGLDPGALQGIERALAQYVGPIARVLTKRAAARAADLGGLCAELAQELPSDQDRARFLNAAGIWPDRRFPVWRKAQLARIRGDQPIAVSCRMRPSPAPPGVLVISDGPKESPQLLDPLDRHRQSFDLVGSTVPNRLAVQSGAAVIRSKFGLEVDRIGQILGAISGGHSYGELVRVAQRCRELDGFSPARWSRETNLFRWPESLAARPAGCRQTWRSSAPRSSIATAGPEVSRTSPRLALRRSKEVKNGARRPLRILSCSVVSYRLRSRARSADAWSPIHSSRTSPASVPLRFSVIVAVRWIELAEAGNCGS